MALRRARHVQRSANVKEFAVMVEVMDFLFVGKQAARLVVQDGILFPGVPKPGDYVNKFTGALIAVAVLGQLSEAEVCRLFLQLRGDDIPACPAVAQKIE